MPLKSKLIGSGAVLLALGGIGGATVLAQASGAATPPAVQAPAPAPKATTPDTPAEQAAEKAGLSDATETEKPNDGPGGWEDPPGNVDNQQTGEN